MVVSPCSLGSNDKGKILYMLGIDAAITHHRPNCTLHVSDNVTFYFVFIFWVFLICSWLNQRMWNPQIWGGGGDLGSISHRVSFTLQYVFNISPHLFMARELHPFLVLISNLIPLTSENVLCMNWIFLNVLRLALWLNRGVQPLASLGHTGRRRAVLGHTLNT